MRKDICTYIDRSPESFYFGYKFPLIPDSGRLGYGLPFFLKIIALICYIANDCKKSEMST